MVTIEQHAAVIGQRLAVIRERGSSPFLVIRIGHVVQERRLIDEALAPAFRLDDFRKQVLDNASTRG